VSIPRYGKRERFISCVYDLLVNNKGDKIMIAYEDDIKWSMTGG